MLTPPCESTVMAWIVPRSKRGSATRPFQTCGFFCVLFLHFGIGELDLKLKFTLSNWYKNIGEKQRYNQNFGKYIPKKPISASLRLHRRRSAGPLVGRSKICCRLQIPIFVFWSYFIWNLLVYLICLIFFWIVISFCDKKVKQKSKTKLSKNIDKIVKNQRQNCQKIDNCQKTNLQTRRVHRRHLESNLAICKFDCHIYETEVPAPSELAGALWFCVWVVVLMLFLCEIVECFELIFEIWNWNWQKKKITNP